MYNHNAAAFAALMNRRASHSTAAPNRYNHAAGIAPPPPPQPPRRTGHPPGTGALAGGGFSYYERMEQNHIDASRLPTNHVYPGHDSGAPSAMMRDRPTPWSRENYHQSPQDQSNFRIYQLDSMQRQPHRMYVDPHFSGGSGVAGEAAYGHMLKGYVDQPHYPLDRSQVTQSYENVREHHTGSWYLQQRIHEDQAWRPGSHGDEQSGESPHALQSHRRHDYYMYQHYNAYTQNIDSNRIFQGISPYDSRIISAGRFDDPRHLGRRNPNPSADQYHHAGPPHSSVSYSGHSRPINRLDNVQDASHIQPLGGASIQRIVPGLPPQVNPAEEFYCDACEKSFEQKTAFDSHIATHEKCSHPGCSFEGSKKVVAAHYHGTHGLYSGTGYKTIDIEGQKFKVLMGTNGKEVEEWRAERRKRFPTTSKVQLQGEVDALISSAGGVPQSQSHERSHRSETGASQSSDAVSAANQTNALIRGEKKGEKGRVCFLFLRSRCTKGANCEYIHDKGAPRPLCKNFSSDRCKYGDKCMYLHNADETTRSDVISQNKDSDRASESSCRESTPSRKRDSRCLDAPRKTNKKCQLHLPVPLGASGSSSSLLRRLLQRQSLEEENSLLQALHFIAENMLNSLAPGDV